MPFIIIGFAAFAAGFYLYSTASTSQVLTGSKNPAEQGGLQGFLSQFWHTFTSFGIGALFGGSSKTKQDTAEKANKAFRTSVSHWAVTHLPMLTGWLNGINQLVRTQTKEQVKFAHTVADAFERQRVHANTKASTAAVAKVNRRVAAAEKQATIARENAHTAHTALDHYKARTNGRVNAAEKAIAVTLPQDIAKVNRRAKTAEQDVTKPNQGLLSRWAKWLWAAGIAGLVVRALAKRFPWLFCRNVSTLAKRACALDSDLLNGLLSATIAIGGAVSVVEFVRDAQAVEGTAIDALRLFIRDFPGR